MDRYQDVYPTKALAGSELLETVHMASAAFARVALYFESSISRADAPLLAPASAAVENVSEAGGRLIVQSKHGVGVPWTKPPIVDGKPWPLTDGSRVWLPPGAHSVEAGAQTQTMRILDFNGDLRRRGEVLPDGSIEVEYSCSSRALAMVDPMPSYLEIDGKTHADGGFWKERSVLPRGRHTA